MKREPIRLARASGEGRTAQRGWRMAIMAAASPVYSTGVVAVAGDAVKASLACS